MEQQNNGTTLQENVKDRKREDRHTNNSHEAVVKSELMKTPVKYLGFVVGNSSVELTDESEAGNCAGPPALTTDNPDTDTDDTGYDETRHSPKIWIEDSLIHNTKLDNFIRLPWN